MSVALFCIQWLVWGWMSLCSEAGVSRCLEAVDGPCQAISARLSSSFERRSVTGGRLLVVPKQQSSRTSINEHDDDEKPEVAPATVRSEQELRNERIARCLAIYYTKPVNADKLRPWSIMHGLIGYGRQAEVIAGGKPVNAAEYLCANGAGNGLRLLGVSNGKLVARIGQGVQGHAGQLLAILAQCDVPASARLTVDGKAFSVQDLIEYEKLGCRSGTELTFKLIGLAHYLQTNAVWKNETGETWDMQRLIREELREPVNTGACGGTHRLMAWTYAVRQCDRSATPLAGEWHNAARMLGAFKEHAFSLQNADGSFSTEFFVSRGEDPDLTRRLYTTGHILEWLVCTLSDEELKDSRISRAVDCLLDLMLKAPDYELDVGPRGHALHALAVYEQRTWGGQSDYAQLLKSGVKYYPTEKALTAKAGSTVPAVQAGSAGRPPASTLPRGGQRFLRRR